MGPMDRTFLRIGPRPPPSCRSPRCALGPRVSTQPTTTPSSGMSREEDKFIPCTQMATYYTCPCNEPLDPGPAFPPCERRMRRLIAAVFLVIIAFYLGAGGVDRCDDGPSDGVQVCHILCSDGCATAPIPVPPLPPPSDPLPRPRFEVQRAEHLATLDIEPEKDPPRA